MKTKFLLKTLAILSYIYGTFYCLSLILFPVGVYCFVFGKKIYYRSENLDASFFVNDKDFNLATKYCSLITLPFGWIIYLILQLSKSNRVKVKDIEKSGIHLGDNKEEKVTPVEAEKEIAYEEKLEKFKKLENFRDKGIITDDELEMAREQLFGKKD